MKRSSIYSLALSGILILTLAAQGLLVAPRLQAAVVDWIPGWERNLAGVLYYLLGLFLAACVFSDQDRNWHKAGNLLAFLFLEVLGFLLLRDGLVVETMLLVGAGIAFVLANWISLERDWLVEVVQWTNLLVGIGMALRPDLTLSAGEYTFFRPVAIHSIYAALFLASTLIRFASRWKPALGGYQSKILAVPWLLWALALTSPPSLFNAIIAYSVVAGLVAKDLLPWEQLALKKNTTSGYPLLGLILVCSGIALASVITITQVIAGTPALPATVILQIQEIAFAGCALLSLLAYVTMAALTISINRAPNSTGSIEVIMKELQSQDWAGQIRNLLFEPLSQVLKNQDYEKLLAAQLSLERRRTAQLNLLHQLNLELESVLDPPVSAQLTANAICSALGTALASIFLYEPESDELVMLATSGPLATNLPPGYRQGLDSGLMGRAARLRHTQLASDTRLDPNYFKQENQEILSEIAVPLLASNTLRGVIVVDHSIPNAFDDSDITVLEAIAIQLVTSWERSGHDQSLTHLIEAGISLSTTLDVEGVIKQIAEIARQTLAANFVFVALVDKGGGYTRTAHVGHAPTLLSILNSDPVGNSLIQASLDSDAAFRLRDVRKRFPSTPTGSNELRSLLSIPIRLRQSSIGVILAFGKKGNHSFSENDESLASLVATQAAAAIETTWLYQELRTLFTTATQLYQLSTRVIQAEQLTDAAASIAETAYQVSKAQSAGIVLFTPEQEIEAKVQIDSNGIHPGTNHPMNLIKQALETGQTIIVAGPRNATRICLPLQTPRHQYGALWVEVPEESWNNARYSDNLHTLANQAAIALERSILLVETRKQADEIESAYLELEVTYDQTLAALSQALDARDRETEGHSLRVARIAYSLAREFGLSVEQAKTLERGAILHDIGKIGISDTILLKPGPLDPKEWQMMRQHPDIGARIIEGVPFLQEALPVIRYHQERWDGSGYPIGLKGTEIPIMARIFAVVDAFDALTTNRPYRSPISVEEAIEYINSKSGILFDPAIVEIFIKMVDEGIVTELT